MTNPSSDTTHSNGVHATGTHRMNLDATRDALLHVPASYTAGEVMPITVMLHGAGGQPEHGLSLMQTLADEMNIIILAPASRGRTWDVILGEYGPDVEFLDLALNQIIERYDINADHVGIGGFSDGASYALSLGLMNGDQFTHILAFSPGFMAPASQKGEPQIFISHGTHDDVLPIERCSWRIVPQLQRAGYEVEYHEFDGPHTVPADIAREAAEWFLAE